MATDEPMERTIDGTVEGRTLSMRQMARTRCGAMTAALLTVAAAGSLVTGCSSGSSATDDGRAPRRAAAKGRRRRRPSTLSSTAGPVLAVKIDNVQRGAPSDGSRRGGRRLRGAGRGRSEPADGHLRQQAARGRRAGAQCARSRTWSCCASSPADARLLGCPAQVAAGHRQGTRAMRCRPMRVPARITAVPPEVAPHNLFCTRAAYALRRRGRRPHHRVPLRCRPGGRQPGDLATVRFPAARFTFAWSASKHRWLVSMDGTPTVTTDGSGCRPRPWSCST